MLSLQAEVHMAQREYDRAIDVWQQAIALDSRSASMQLRLADALIAAKRFDEAAARLQAALALNAGADAHRRLADGVCDAGSQRRSCARETRLHRAAAAGTAAACR
jgi:tetratricopeptide (TPR) repeat protein